MKRRRAWSVEISSDARTEIERAADDQLPHEAGGLLFGWIGEGVIHVDQAIAIPPSSSQPASYLRDSARSARALAAALEHEPADSPRGYVGEWHSHPANIGASATDRRTMRSIASQSATPVALTIARHTAPHRWALDSDVVQRPLRPRRKAR